MKKSNIFTVIHVSSGTIQTVQSFKSKQKARNEFDKCCKEFNYNDDHLVITDFDGNLKWQACESDDLFYGENNDNHS